MSAPSGPPDPPVAPGDARSSVATVGAIALDAAAVLAFVIIGRRSHQESSAVADTARTAAPFLLALIPAWLIAEVWDRPRRLRTGAIVWVVTLAVGMFNRRVFFGEGTASTFIVVTGLFLAACFLGWRLAAATFSARNRRRAAAPA